MSRHAAIDLAAYEVADILEALDAEAYLARDRAEIAADWERRRAVDPTLPPLDALLLDSDPSSLVLQQGAVRETLLRARVNDALRSLTLAGARQAALEHIGMTYFRGVARRAGEDDETYRQRIALSPESWSIAGPVGAYVFWTLSASPDVLDVAVYSEDEGVCLAPRLRVALLQRYNVTDPLADPTASPALLATVQTALRRADLRPLGDHVVTESATPLPFDLSISLLVRAGVGLEAVIAAADRRVRPWCRGLLRWAGDGETGPTWLIGRTLPVETIAGVAMGGDPNILAVDVAGGDINAPHPDYTAAALAGVGEDSFTPLPAEVTAHLFRAPILRTLTITATTAPTGWIG